MEPVVVVATGIGNTASVTAAIRRCGWECEVTGDAELVRSAARVVLPGVGSFGTGMASLVERGLDLAIVERVRDDRPLLAICLGLQLLCLDSEESPGVQGLGVVAATVRRFPESVRTPQFGWNRVEATGCRLVKTGDAYYANSYRVSGAPEGWVAATTTHGAPFVASLERGSVLACQFHPELSGAWGSELIARWLVGARETAPC